MRHFLVNQCHKLSTVKSQASQMNQSQFSSEQQQRESSQDQFQPQYHTMKKLRLKINKKRLSNGFWQLDEDKIYLSFIQANKQSFQSEEVRRKERIYCQLSAALSKKRTPDQCRNHHKKMLNKYNQSIDNIIMGLNNKYLMEKDQKFIIKQRNLGKHLAKKNSQVEGNHLPQQFVYPLKNILFKTLDKQNQQEILRRKLEGSFYKLSLHGKQGRIRLQINSGLMQSY